MMKLQTILTAAVISLSTGVANAATVWMPTNTDTDFLQFEIGGLSTNGGSLALFDEADFGGTGLIIGSEGGEVHFQSNGSNWDATFYDENSLAGGTITLSNDYNFVLGMSWDAGSSWYEDSSYSLQGGPSDSYQINFDGFNDELVVVGSTLAVDLQPVPVPAAVWLFGSGLLGLAAIARRRR